MGHEGFTSVTDLDAARTALRHRCEPHRRTEAVSVGHARGRVLATAARANRDVPHYDRAAVDGYAVRARDTFGASERSPVTLSPTANSAEEGEAVHVHTGSALPDGTDAVVMVEHTECRGDAVAVFDAVAGGENVASAGEDVAAGRRLFEAGRRLRPSDLALLRAAGTRSVDVVSPPRVSVVPTGDELVATDPVPGEAVETNGMMVSELVEQWHGTATYRDVVGDDVEALRTAVERDTDHDVVVTTGGSSVGERDLVADAVADAGEVLTHGVAIKPGHPVGTGIVDETPVLMLPGYPVSCLVTAVLFLRPTLAWLCGTDPVPLPTTRARLSTKLRSAPGERTFARVRLEEPADGDEVASAEVVSVGGAGVLSSVAFADGWVVVPESREGIPAGERVTVRHPEPTFARPP